MAEQHVKLLQGLGIDAATIETVEKMEADKVKDWDPAEIQNKVKEGYKTGFLNDNDFLNSIPEEKIPADLKKKIETGQVTRFQNEMKEVAMKDLGLEEKDFEDLNKGQKDSVIKAMTKLIAGKHLSKKGNVEGLKDMQKQVQDLTEKLEGKDADWQNKLNTELEKVGGAGAARALKAITRAAIAVLPGVKLNVPPAYITDPVLARLNNAYTLVLDDNDEIQVRQKANKELKVLDGSKEVTFDDILKKQLLLDKLATEEGKEEKPKPKKVTIGGEGSEEEVDGVPQYIKDKMEKNMEK